MTSPPRTVIYEVDLTVDAGAAADVAAWLPGHVRRVLACDGFLSAQWLEADVGAAAARWSLRYTVRDADALEAYLAGPAVSLRREGETLFPGRFTATRRITRLRQTFDSSGDAVDGDAPPNNQGEHLT